MKDQRDDQLSFEARTGYLLARLGSLAERSWIGMLRRHNLTPSQHAVLLALRERGPLGQQDLGRLIAVDPRNVVPILDGLAGQHLIGRHVDPADRRRRVINLTETGRSAADDLAKSVTDIETGFLRGLNSADQAELNRLLRTLHASLTP
ncbi:MarR family winged helix-turn-helix transcriptional regulator [Amycolatopsis samaneae]|uniref:MarR family winged helix-turn-helix transcriptional regulator n=1 Tax=Amycolatopsis samaneae TaxID=664691 RepID=A0ABW5GGP9_9PSEU